MSTTIRRAGRFTARLGLECLEGRVLPSATVPAPTSGTAQTASVQATAGYTYSWSISPGAVLLGTNSSTGNGKSSGSIMVALYAPGSSSATVGGPAVSVSLGLVTTSSSAVAAKPDVYNTPFSITLKLKDSGSGASGTLTFAGTITGTLSWDRSSLVVAFTSPTQKVTLGGRLYTISLPGKLGLGTPDSAPVKISASIQVSVAPSSTTAQGPTSSYISAAYHDVLGRAPEPAALASWSAALDSQALSRGQFANALTHSDEYYARFITAAYQRYLGRAPDGTGLAAWLLAMKSGLSDEQLEAGFLGSPEYIGKHGGTGAGWVSGLYHDLLGRIPSQAEIDAWVNALAHGLSTQQVAYGFAASAEREALRVRDDYFTFLGRTPSQAEVGAWVFAFQHGVSNEDVIAGFVASPEYYQRHTT